MAVGDSLVQAADRLRKAVDKLRFVSPVSHVYNPLNYAWAGHEAYLSKYGNPPKRVVFVGMNPGPFGMVQTGIPFGQIAAVRDWMQINARIGRAPNEHPKRPITGFECQRSEISGERLWGLFAKRFDSAEAFFRDHFVANYCPLAFVEESGRNRTPDKLLPEERAALFAPCDEHLREVARILEPEWLVGVGDFAAKRIEHVFKDTLLRICRILHPSPASPAANRDWPALATSQLQKSGIWK